MTSLSLALLLLLAAAGSVALVVALVRAVRRDGYGTPRPDPRAHWFAPLDPR